MVDVVYLALIVGAFAALVGLVRIGERIVRAADVEPASGPDGEVGDER